MKSQPGMGSFVGGGDDPSQSRASFRHVIRGYEARLGEEQRQRKSRSGRRVRYSSLAAHAAPLTQAERKIIREHSGRAHRAMPVVVIDGHATPEVKGKTYYHTTPSGKTIVRFPNAYGYPTKYHPSTLRVEVGAGWLHDQRRQKMWPSAVSETMGDTIDNLKTMHESKPPLDVFAEKNFGFKYGTWRRDPSKRAAVLDAVRKDRSSRFPTTEEPPLEQQQPEQMRRRYAAKLDHPVDKLFEDSLGIKREDMPQIPDPVKEQFLMGLIRDGIGHRDLTVDPKRLKPSQGEWSQDALDRVAESYDAGGEERNRLLNNRVTVSKCGHVLDGHHRWLAARLSGRKLKTVVVNLPIRELLEAAREFGKREGIAQKEV